MLMQPLDKSLRNRLEKTIEEAREVAASAPWYPLFNGDRINDRHLPLAEKRAARKAKESSS